jgi:hypothetical protein
VRGPHRSISLARDPAVAGKVERERARLAGEGRTLPPALTGLT